MSRFAHKVNGDLIYAKRAEETQTGSNIDDSFEAVAVALDAKVKSVKIGSSSGSELNSSGNVIIPLAVATGTTGAKAGAMSANDKKALDDLKSGAVTNVVYVANQSGGGGSLKKTVNGTDTVVMDFMTDTEAAQLFADAKAAMSA